MCPLQMSMLLNEYLSSADIQEVGTSCVLPPLPLPPLTGGTSHTPPPSLQACRCLSDLDVPHFHHELVYEVCCLQPAVYAAR